MHKLCVDVCVFCLNVILCFPRILSAQLNNPSTTRGKAGRQDQQEPASRATALLQCGCHASHLSALDAETPAVVVV